MNNICIHTQTHLPHFKYTNELICSFLQLTNIMTLKIPIFIIFDNDELIQIFKQNYTYEYDLIHFLNIEKVINNFHLDFKEKTEDLFKNTIDITWGAGGHRNYVAVKRTYSILELERLGYNYVWCLDSESLVLKNTNLEPIIGYNIQKPLLTVGQNKDGVKYKEIVETLFNYDYNNFQDISVRMNDFWFIHTTHFKSMIQLLFNIHKQPISYFMNGSEQSVYEYFIYSLYIKDNTLINLITIYGDLHGNTLFNQIIQSDIQLDDVCKNLNDNYFNYIQSFRGDYYRLCLTNNRGTEFIQKLNINIAVSNYTGI